MMKLKLVNAINENQTKYFKQYSDEHVYNTLTQIIYKGQVPMAAYVLIEGTIILKDAQKRIIEEINPTSLIGFYEIFEQRPFKYTAEISPGSRVLILPRSTIFEIQSHCKDLEVCPKKDLKKLSHAAS